MPGLPPADLGQAINIAVTVGGAALATLFTAGRAARRAVADELIKARNARGFQRRVEWYEHARRELRELGDLGSFIFAAEGSYSMGFASTKESGSDLIEVFADASGRVTDLILDASIYGQAETVRALTELLHQIRQLTPYLPLLTGQLEEGPSLTSTLDVIAEATGVRDINGTTPEERRLEVSGRVEAIHEALAAAMRHVLDETRELHGYSSLGGASALTDAAILDAVLEPPRASVTLQAKERRLGAKRE